MSVHLDRVQSVLQRWKVIASGSCTSEHRVRLYLRDLQNEFNAEAPCTMFLADSLNHPSGKMCLLTHVSDGIPQKDRRAWEHSMTRSSSPILKRIRKKFSDKMKVGKTLSCVRSDVISDFAWWAHKTLAKMARRLEVHDQMFAWQQKSEFAVAVILRSKAPKRFRETDSAVFKEILESVLFDTELATSFTPDVHLPYLTPKQVIVRDFLLAGMSDGEIEVNTGSSSSTIRKDLAEIRLRYKVDKRAEVILSHIERGGNVEEILQKWRWHKS